MRAGCRAGDISTEIMTRSYMEYHHQSRTSCRGSYIDEECKSGHTVISSYGRGNSSDNKDHRGDVKEEEEEEYNKNGVVEDGYGYGERRPRVLGVVSQLLSRLILRMEEEEDPAAAVAIADTDAEDDDSEEFDARRRRRGGMEEEEEEWSVFHGQQPPSISIHKYVDRIFRYARCSPACFVVALVYLDRLHQNKNNHNTNIHNVNHSSLLNSPPRKANAAAAAAAPDSRRHTYIPINALTVHRLLITTVMVAAKFLDDSYFNNAYYAKVGGVSTMEMNRLELELLFRIGFRLHVTVEMFDVYCRELARGTAEEEPMMDGRSQAVLYSSSWESRRQQHEDDDDDDDDAA